MAWVGGNLYLHVQGHFPLDQAAPSLILSLSTSRDGAAATSQGNLCKVLTTLTGKNLFLISNLTLLPEGFKPFLLVLSLHVLVNSLCPSFLQVVKAAIREPLIPFVDLLQQFHILAVLWPQSWMLPCRWVLMSLEGQNPLLLCSFSAAQDTFGAFRAVSAHGWVMPILSSTSTPKPFPAGLLWVCSSPGLVSLC